MILHDRKSLSRGIIVFRGVMIIRMVMMDGYKGSNMMVGNIMEGWMLIWWGRLRLWIRGNC